MRLPICYAVLQVAMWASIIQLGSMMYLDPENDLTEDEFLAVFGLSDTKDVITWEERSAALKEHEVMIQKENDDFASGRKTWWDKLNSFADLPDDELEKVKTGLKVKSGRRHKRRRYGRGLIPHNKTDDRSEKYFDTFRFGRGSTPRSYSAVDEGIVSPIKDQACCGACGAFATMGVIETCFKKITGVFGDYSEQELIDCAYGQDGANECHGANVFSYALWITKNKRELMHENDYQYLVYEPKLTCPATKPYRQGAKVTDYYYTNNGDEELLKKLIYEHGAVLIGMATGRKKFFTYGGGIYDGCGRDGESHGAVAVGYGTENGEDYWLIKNSYGEKWGENGFMKVKRGACKVGRIITTITCESVPGPTDPQRPTCVDHYKQRWCKIHADAGYCDISGVQQNCEKSCGICEV